MNKTTLWTAIVIIFVCAVSIGYAAVVVNAAQDPPAEVRIIHEYTEGYYDGYAKGKAQALEDITDVYYGK